MFGVAMRKSFLILSGLLVFVFDLKNQFCLDTNDRLHIESGQNMNIFGSLKFVKFGIVNQL